MDKIKTIYYRGFLKSCNFACDYCPFAKKACTSKELAKDKAALLRFYETIAEMANIETIFIIPYGEAMIHPYYHEILVKISKLPHIKHVSIQSNLSWPVEQVLQTFDAMQADISKIHFWLTYHLAAKPVIGETWSNDTTRSVVTFLQKCLALHEHGLRFCVGSVAKSGDILDNQFGEPPLNVNIAALGWLKNRLPADTYFWLNALEGANVQYSDEEIAAFTELDPLFPLELNNIKADSGLCDAGEKSIFVKANGDIYPCILSKQALGNLYENTFEKLTTCKCKLCSCYLAYSCRRDIVELNEFMGEGKAIRLPK
ncbi:MAG: STM4011 family radical SAM protein [Deferribacteraceae bacterium]|jgi:MoaA/NifB/PqqE/SkfB family radical SAM enzyme|nr:STM4011 family radical SAM protein [Deferribacteraceae bacterium]